MLFCSNYSFNLPLSFMTKNEKTHFLKVSIRTHPKSPDARDRIPKANLWYSDMSESVTPIFWKRKSEEEVSGVHSSLLPLPFLEAVAAVETDRCLANLLPQATTLIDFTDKPVLPKNHNYSFQHTLQRQHFGSRRPQIFLLSCLWSIMKNSTPTNTEKQEKRSCCINDSTKLRPYSWKWGRWNGKHCWYIT